MFFTAVMKQAIKLDNRADGEQAPSWARRASAPDLIQLRCLPPRLFWVGGPL
jgi:hypothetical protein